VNYDVYFKDLRGGDHTWLYMNGAGGEDYKLELDTANLENRTCTIDWEVGIMDEEGEFSYIAAPGATTYEVSADSSYITMYANGLWDDLAVACGAEEGTWIGFNVRAIVRVNGEEVSRTDTWAEIRDEHYHYYVPRGETSMLPGWTMEFYTTTDVYMENPEYPTGGTERIPVSMDVANAGDDEGEGDVLLCEELENGEGWLLTATRTGHAVITFTYTTLLGEEVEDILDVYVTDDYYGTIINTSTGTDKMLPGSSMDIMVDLYHLIYTEEDGEQEVEVEGEVTFNWYLEDENALSLMSMEQDEANPNILHVTANPDVYDWSEFVVWADAYVDGHHVATIGWVTMIAPSYFQIFAEEVIATPGETVEIPMIMKHIYMENPAGELVEGANLRIKEVPPFLSISESGTGIVVAEDAWIPEGETFVAKFVVCGETMDEWGNEIYEEAEVAMILCNHNVVTDKAVAATCTKTGLTEGSHCTICEKVIVKQEVTKALGHKKVTDKAVAATCTKTGLTEGSHCSVCNQVLVAQKTVAKVAHSYKDTVTKATLKANGKIVTACTRCRAVKTTQTVNKVTKIQLAKDNYVYNGKVNKPAVTVKDGKNKVLKLNRDYTVKYASGCKNPGSYTVTVTLKGNYSGSKKLTYTIEPKSITLSKVTAAKKGFKVTWKKGTGVTGYEIEYSTSKKFDKKTTKKVTITKANTTSKSVAKLKAKQKYFVRIRTYKTAKVNGKNTKLYSAWSKTKSVTTKK